MRKKNNLVTLDDGSTYQLYRRDNSSVLFEGIKGFQPEEVYGRMMLPVKETIDLPPYFREIPFVPFTHSQSAPGISRNFLTYLRNSELAEAVDPTITDEFS